jgi:hypothetical protein
MKLEWTFGTARSLVLAIALTSLPGCDATPNEEATETAAQPVPTTPSSRAEIFGRLADTFVASETYPTGDMIFYAPPKAYGSWLCRVDKITVPEWIAHGRPKNEGEKWKDDIEVERYYAAWRSPAEGTDDNREAACAKFRDFDSLFSADGTDGPGRYIFLLDRLLRDLAMGKTSYPVECLDRRESRTGKPCDAKVVASGLSIKRLSGGQTESERETENSSLRTDQLHFRVGDAHGHPVVFTLRIDSEQHFGRQSMDEGDIRSAGFELLVV